MTVITKWFVHFCRNAKISGFVTNKCASTTAMATPLFFSTFEVTRQAFHRTALTYAIVNLKPIVPGRTSAATVG
jgi:hypothetical protein